jgi:hypothetical protein
VIGKAILTGQSSEVFPVAPRPGVHAPLVMERVFPGIADAQLIEHATEIVELSRILPPPWQRLVGADFGGSELTLFYERFVGITLGDLFDAMDESGRLLPLDVLRAVIEQVCDGLALHPTPWPVGPPTMRCTYLSPDSIGLSIDGRWQLAQGALNHWLCNVVTQDRAYDGPPTLSAATISLLSPEAIRGAQETSSSLASRVSLYAWQLATGGLHPYRGRSKREQLPSLTRYTQDHIHVPLELNPELPPAVSSVLTRGIAYRHDRFADLASFRAALDTAWTKPAATPARTMEVLASFAWKELHKELESLKREPMLPIRWDGVWSGARTPEQGIAVLEDQLMERLEPLERFPQRLPFHEPPERVHTPFNEVYVPEPPPVPREPPRNFFQRLIALFRG